MNYGEGSGRKVRADKKRDVKPTVSLELRDCIYRISFITDVPIKDVIEAICINGIGRRIVVGHLSLNFRRNIRISNTLYRGDPERMPVKKRQSSGRTDRIHTRVLPEMYDALASLAYALDCSVSRACALLLDASVRDSEFINEFVRRYLEKNIDDERMRELRKVLKYINANNPYNEVYSWAALLSFMVEEVRESAGKVTDTVSTFLVNNWREK